MMRKNLYIMLDLHYLIIKHLYIMVNLHYMLIQPHFTMYVSHYIMGYCLYMHHHMDFSRYIMHTLQHIIKCEQDILTMMNQMFLFLTIRQLWRSIHERYSTIFFADCFCSKWG